MTDILSIPYAHLYTDSDCLSRQTLCHMTEFEMKAIQPTAAPQWQGHSFRGDTTVMFTVLPVGWVGEWHENPAPQWIIPLRGRWFVESMDGDRREFGPGDLSFGADQGCCTVDGKTGHLSGTVGDEDCRLMLVQCTTLNIPSSPCSFT